jgi:hypothetical protein
MRGEIAFTASGAKAFSPLTRCTRSIHAWRTVSVGASCQSTAIASKICRSGANPRCRSSAGCRTTPVGGREWRQHGRPSSQTTLGSIRFLCGRRSLDNRPGICASVVGIVRTGDALGSYQRAESRAEMQAQIRAQAKDRDIDGACKRIIVVDLVTQSCILFKLQRRRRGLGRINDRRDNYYRYHGGGQELVASHVASHVHGIEALP